MTILFNDENKDYVLQDNYPISISDEDMQYAIKPSSLLNYMQGLASRAVDADNSPYSRKALGEIGLGWFLIRYRIEFDKYPKNLKNIKIQTENRGFSKLSAFRDFEGFDGDKEERLFRATTSWYVVNLETKSIVPPVDEHFFMFRKFEKREDDLTLRKLRTPDRTDNEKMFHVRYDDLDMNGHVNNVVYITWALEALDFDFRTTHQMKNVDIYFKHEVTYGDDILSCVKIDKENKTTEHVIKLANTGEEVCLIKIEFE